MARMQNLEFRLSWTTLKLPTFTFFRRQLCFDKSNRKWSSFRKNEESDMSSVYLHSFASDVLVKCPRCGALAHLLETPGIDQHHPGHRLICATCCNERIWTPDGGAWKSSHGW